MDRDPIADALADYLSAERAYSEFTFPFFENVGGDRGRQIKAIHETLEQARNKYLQAVEAAQTPEPPESSEPSESTES